MRYAKLGKTDIMVPVMAMGCWALAGDLNWGRQDDADSVATVYAALDAGVNFFDTAEMYGDGRSELVLGRALKGIRHEAIIATKVSPADMTGEGVLEACERSLKRLQTDYIDLLQTHWLDPTIPLTETWGAMERLVTGGKVRAIGVSNLGVRDLTDLLEIGWCEVDQLPYSLLWRAIEYEIKQACIDHEVGILAYSPLAQGLLTGKYRSPEQVPDGRARSRHFARERPHTRHDEEGCEAELFAAIEQIRTISEALREPMAQVALAWVLQQAAVTAVIAGARRPEQIRQNAQAIDLELGPTIVDELAAATEELKQKLGPNPDMWDSESRIR